MYLLDFFLSLILRHDVTEVLKDFKLIKKSFFETWYWFWH